MRTAVAQLGECVVGALEQAMTALVQHDAALATAVMVDDDAIDDGCAAIKRMSVRVLTLQQPLVRDLRDALAAVMIVEELERMGDHAQGLARLVPRLPATVDPHVLAALGELGYFVRHQVADALASYRSTDVSRAREVWAGDAAVDRRYASLVQALLGDMATTQGATTRDTYLLWIAHDLERIADRAANICEHVVFIATGNRHMTAPPRAVAQVMPGVTCATA